MSDNRMLRWPHADIRETTAQLAIAKMADALRFYAEGDWNHDYPGGIDVSPNTAELDMGERAARALRDSHVRRVIEAIDR